MIDAIAGITLSASQTATEGNFDELIRNLDILKALCSEEHEMSKRNLVMMRSNGGLDALHALMVPSQNPVVLAKSLTTLEIVSTNSGESYRLLLFAVRIIAEQIM